MPEDIQPDRQALAISAEALYLLNLLFPILPLLALLLIHFKNHNTYTVFLQSHTVQPLIAALLSTALFIIINVVAYLTGGYTSMDSLISIHSLIALEAYTLVVIIPFSVPGLIGVTKAMAGQSWRYPLIGRLLRI